VLLLVREREMRRQGADEEENRGGGKSHESFSDAFCGRGLMALPGVRRGRISLPMSTWAWHRL
jgi:hypothetical protein